MDDARAMCFVERVGDFDGVPKYLIDWQCTLVQALSKRLAFEIFHDEEVEGTVAADIVERADMRVRES